MTPRRGTVTGPWMGNLEELAAAQGADGYAELLRVPALSLGLFLASTGYDDHQYPHAEDEVYVVTEGRAVLDVAGSHTGGSRVDRLRAGTGCRTGSSTSQTTCACWSSSLRPRAEGAPPIR